jgi:hypothetical protein
MRQAGLRAALWSAFALLILTGGYVMLRACDFGFAPLFGSTSCAVPAHEAELAAEREKQAHLRSSIHNAEIRLALLPACPIPAPPKIPDPPPKPVDLPKPVDPPKPADPPKPQITEKFEIPKKVEELKGCWQSTRGDIEIVSDDAQEKPLGNARFCYCFGSNGRGMVQILYSDGDVCRAGLIARITSDHVLMHHDKVNCRKHSYYVATDITCGNDDQSSDTTCEIHNLGKIGNKSSEQFIRVTNEHCNWGG